MGEVGGVVALAGALGGVLVGVGVGVDVGVGVGVGDLISGGVGAANPIPSTYKFYL